MKNNGLAIFGLSLAAALIVCTFLFTQTLKQTVPSNQIVKVRGVSERIIESDRVEWSISFSYIDKDLNLVYEKMAKARTYLTNYFVKNGIPKDKIYFSSSTQQVMQRRVNLDDKGNYKYEFQGYSISQKLQILEYDQLDLIEKLSKNIGADVQRAGWPILPGKPYYYFSKKISDIKPELLKEAAKSAYERASIIAESSGSKLGALKAARQGAFDGFSDDGFVGGNSREHRVTAVITVDFSIEK